MAKVVLWLLSFVLSTSCFAVFPTPAETDDFLRQYQSFAPDRFSHDPLTVYRQFGGAPLRLALLLEKEGRIYSVEGIVSPGDPGFITFREDAEGAKEGQISIHRIYYYTSIPLDDFEKPESSASSRAVNCVLMVFGKGWFWGE